MLPYRKAIVGGLGLLLACVPLAGQVPTDSVLSDFQLRTDFVLEVDGQPAAGAEIYNSDRAAAFLVIAPEIPRAVVLSLRTRTVETVDASSLTGRREAAVQVLDNAVFEPAGTFTIEGQALSFTIGDLRLVLTPRPNPLGLHTAADLRAAWADYGRTADAYRPSAEGLDRLRDVGGPVRVRVYFGTWCRPCSPPVPKLLALADALEGSTITFEFYGVPPPPAFAADAAVVADGVKGVPHVLVVAGDDEIRYSGEARWETPSTRLAEILEGGPAGAVPPSPR